MKSVLALFFLLLATLTLVAVAPFHATAQTAQSEAATSQTPDAAKPKSRLAGRDDARASPGWYGRAMTWLRYQQQTLNRALAGSVRDLKTRGSLAAALVLAGLSFQYGILQAAGPGHGKAIISSYAIASAETVRRSISLSFLAAFFQAVSAIVLIGILALVLKSTGVAIQQASRHLEQVSFALITGFGAWLLIRALRRYVFAARASTGHGHAYPHDHDHAHEHGHHDGHSHAHLPDPADLSGAWSWRRSVWPG